MKQYALLSLIMVMLALSGCQYLGQGNDTQDTGATGQIILDDDDFMFLNESEDKEDMSAGEKDEEPAELTDIDEEDVAYTVEVTEGDLVRLDLIAVDPDGDNVEYEYSSPLNAQGRWQTQIGDEGKYLITVTASDGKLATSEDVLLSVGRANRAPTIECEDEYSVKEGDTLVIDCNIYDEEGDSILVSYEGWTTSSSKRTTFDDAGEYTVLVRASDSNQEATRTVDVVIENVNRDPVMEAIDDITVMETTRIQVSPTVNDPDGDAITLSFSSPLDEDGNWLTTDGDAGTYQVSVVASDGSASVTEDFQITVTQINTAPILKPISDMTVDEGETIKIPVNAFDPEGDEITISFSGYMDSDTYTVGYDEAGEYEQSVTVSDGVLSSTETFTITVENQNRPPEFVIPEDGE